ncbi:isoleucine patch superfamily enzyme, carbonic anhydrase/acetyltransferase (plasmid) [Pseudonocardia dioxanivorans CB1190]|uniref:Isoleucine patch superfamily enzyme, carbonic anhydrase/acetyltransferase n=1 Tax=Pseudonocardia dioxanivorans (strain ATCC 55486 / DSM 44775 / JCM 13855 / CB1190) TaxID=675635 RepID=F2L6H1_PSEUX|nr:gamma carbonic anhydrase family protein [Pseudonocardia dioxanivorans]AEA28865.1 isoleucine patch superfamily enzyme, carbonic anhydrase/acetyltransferase [Pseudonocardia dioxanivorans CB1190]
MSNLYTCNGYSPAIADTAWVAPTATLIGEVLVGEGSGVWYAAVLRADEDFITLGVGSNVQDGSVIHADPSYPVRIGDDVSIGHRAVVHGATVQDSCLIGMGSVILNGAVIGHGSLVAAGAVVLEGEEIPPGSLVAGTPAKVRRAIDPDGLSLIRKNAQNYRRLLRLHQSAKEL